MYRIASLLQGTCRFSVICRNRTALISFSVYKNLLAFPTKSNISSGNVSPESGSAGITPCGFFFSLRRNKTAAQHRSCVARARRHSSRKIRSRHMSTTASPLHTPPRQPDVCMRQPAISKTITIAKTYHLASL